MDRSKSSRWYLLYVFILFSALIGVFFFYRNYQTPKETKKPSPPRLASAKPVSGGISLSGTKKRKSVAVPGKQTYSIISSHKSPEFTKAVIDPEDVKLGEKQTMTVSVKDEKATIVSVIAEIETDKGKINHPLFLKNGDASDGVWEGSWIVKDTHDTTYVTIFRAKNKIGETGEARISWTDPGCGCTGTNCTISGNCTVSGTDGADGGTLTINGGTVTISSVGSYLVASVLNVAGGALSLSYTATVYIYNPTVICMTDGDSDGWPASTTQVAYSGYSSCPAGRRRYLMSSITTTDCNDGNATQKPGSTYCDTSGTDWNCSGSATACAPQLYTCASWAGFNWYRCTDCYSRGYYVTCTSGLVAAGCGASAYTVGTIYDSGSYAGGCPSGSCYSEVWYRGSLQTQTCQ